MDMPVTFKKSIESILLILFKIAYELVNFWICDNEESAEITAWLLFNDKQFRVNNI
jgi:hypothetical protein